MDEIRYIAENLGKTGMSIEKIANVLEVDIHIIESWLNETGINPREYKDMLYQRQMDGIAAAKAKGIKFGRPRVEPPDNFSEIVNALENKVITTKEAMRQSGMAEATFYRRLREYRKRRSETIYGSGANRSACAGCGGVALPLRMWKRNIGRKPTVKTGCNL